jgi:hypothetical protein
MHVLDLIMYIVLAVLLWWIIDKVSNGEFTNELGTLGGIFFEVAFLIAYIIIFVVFDNDWVDIFSSFKNINLPDITW